MHAISISLYINIGKVKFMKDLLKAIVLFIICVFIISCKKTVTSQKGAGASAEFPPFLAGTWAAEEGMWQMTFKPDGSLESIKFYFVSAPIDTAKGAADRRERMVSIQHGSSETTE